MPKPLASSPPGFLTAKQAAERLGVSPGRIRQLVTAGRLRVSFRLSGSSLFRIVAVEALEVRTNGRPKSSA